MMQETLSFDASAKVIMGFSGCDALRIVFDVNVNRNA